MTDKKSWWTQDVENRAGPAAHGDPVCTNCGTVHDRSAVIAELRSRMPELFRAMSWNTSFDCSNCGERVAIAGYRDHITRRQAAAETEAPPPPEKSRGFFKKVLARFEPRPGDLELTLLFSDDEATLKGAAEALDGMHDKFAADRLPALRAARARITWNAQTQAALERGGTGLRADHTRVLTLNGLIGRILGRAFGALKEGMSGSEVRALMGDPDRVMSAHDYIGKTLLNATNRGDMFAGPEVTCWVYVLPPRQSWAITEEHFLLAFRGGRLFAFDGFVKVLARDWQGW